MSSPKSLADPAAADVRPYDQAAGRALSVPISLGLFWLLLGSVIALIHSIQLHTPSFFSSVSFFTFGRIQAASETALLYGFAGNAGLAVALWVLGRLGGASPRGLGFSTAGSLLWNLGVAVSVVGILAGHLSGHPLLQVPGYALPILILASAACAATGIFAWTDRLSESSFASQWYAVAALFLFPWLASTAFVFLHQYATPGVSRAIVSAWLSQNLLYLWVSPIILTILYYLTPRITGLGISSYQTAKGGFWALFGIGAWTGTRSLAGGPVPAWLPSLGIAATIVLLIHFIIVAVNLRELFGATRGSVAARFLTVALFSYLLGGVWDLVCSFRLVSAWLQFTYVAEARLMLLLLGSLVPAVLGALYFAMPRLTGKPWASDVLILQHFRLTLLSVLLLVGGLLLAGLVQAVGLHNPDTTFAVLLEQLKPWLLVSTAGIGLVLLGASYMAVNLVLQLLPSCCFSSTPCTNETPSAHAS